MRIVILGTRGFPNVQGGVEKHCQELTKNLVKLGNDVIVLTRAPYVDQVIKEYNGVKLVSLPVLRIKWLETVLHTFMGVFVALKYKPDILHVQAIGPGLFVPLARILGMKVVLTTHGSNYKHRKWGRFAKAIFRIAEYVGIKFANSVIAVSNNIAVEMRDKYGRDINFIPNGVNAPLVLISETILKKHKLEKGKYILSVGRFVPEKGFELLINAFAQAQKQELKDYKLVIAGDTDYKDFYSRNLKKLARETDNVVLTGFLTGQPLEELYSHAALFVLPSYYEGLPIVLMEALSYGLSCIGSDIVANREVGLEEDRYFKPGDISAIAMKIREFARTPLSEDQRQRQIQEILERYDWLKIAKDTTEIYNRVCGLSFEKNFSNLKIAVIGTRGFPGIQGGVERHCEQLYPQLARLGCQIFVFTRKPYSDPSIKEYKQVKLINTFCVRGKYLEAVSHTPIGILKAKSIGVKLLHVHAIGPSLFVPLARLLGLKVVMTHHGPDYERKKWNWIAKVVLHLGEWCGVCFSNQVICISQTIADHVRQKYGRETTIIPNGVTILNDPSPVTIFQSKEILQKYNLEEGKYILAVGRFVPEKGFEDLIDAFRLGAGSYPAGYKLVIVGDADHADEYSAKLKERAIQVKGVMLTGRLTGLSLKELYTHAGLFVLPSYYEGLPIVLLEALSYGLSCIASDIPPNREIEFDGARYFPPGDVDALAEKIGIFLARPLMPEEKVMQIKMVSEKYNWEKIAADTFKVYQKAMG